MPSWTTSPGLCFLHAKGSAPRGDAHAGKAQVRKGLAARFEGIPDVHYGDDTHWVCGDFGVSEWTLTGTSTAGRRLNVRGVDLLEFKDDKIVRKDSCGRSMNRRVGHHGRVRWPAHRLGPHPSLEATLCARCPPDACLIDELFDRLGGFFGDLEHWEVADRIQVAHPEPGMVPGKCLLPI